MFDRLRSPLTATLLTVALVAGGEGGGAWEL